MKAHTPWLKLKTDPYHFYAGWWSTRSGAWFCSDVLADKFRTVSWITADKIRIYASTKPVEGWKEMCAWNNGKTWTVDGIHLCTSPVKVLRKLLEPTTKSEIPIWVTIEIK